MDFPWETTFFNFGTIRASNVANEDLAGKSVSDTQNRQEFQMLRLTKWLGVPVLAFALIGAIDTPQAEAGNGFQIQIGGYGFGNTPSYHTYQVPIYSQPYGGYGQPYN